ncbi:hypothetical protein [Mesorhizobium sp. M1406]|uniref:hypothetical protein n=1 Tax=Mesorhizobium sp. M1406 TaxID=2957099 RepID=UPI00333DD7BE
MSLLRRALVEMPRGPDDIVELFGPARVREITIAALKATGCALESDPETVERLIGYAAKVDVEPWLREWQKSSEPASQGRPRTDLFETIIYTAALYRFRGTIRNPAAVAAKWLGEPATKDKVEKRDQKFRRIFARVYEHVGLSRAIGVERPAQLLLDVILDLERLDAKMAAERAAGARAKKTTRHASFSAQLSPAN